MSTCHYLVPQPPAPQQSQSAKFTKKHRFAFKKRTTYNGNIIMWKLQANGSPNLFSVSVNFTQSIHLHDLMHASFTSQPVMISALKFCFKTCVAMKFVDDDDDDDFGCSQLVINTRSSFPQKDIKHWLRSTVGGTPVFGGQTDPVLRADRWPLYG